MQDYLRYLTLTKAQAAQRFLASQGISSRVRRDPLPDKNSGCSFALFVPKHFDRATALLREQNLLGALQRSDVP